MSGAVLIRNAHQVEMLSTYGIDEAADMLVWCDARMVAGDMPSLGQLLEDWSAIANWIIAGRPAVSA